MFEPEDLPPALQQGLQQGLPDVRESPPQEYTRERFDRMFSDSADPWSFQSRWYEARKRALTLACLPASRYASAYEPGCANGELSAALAPRCDRLLVSDGSARAVDLSRARLRAWSHVQVLQAWLPDEWPEGRFDLVVISELAYFLTSADIDELARRTRASLLPGGTVLACHWRHPIAGCALSGDAVQQRLEDGLGLHVLSTVVEEDLRLTVWSLDARSVAQREGFA